MSPAGNKAAAKPVQKHSSVILSSAKDLPDAIPGLREIHHYRSK